MKIQQATIADVAERAGVTLPKAEFSREAREASEKKNTLLEINRLAANYRLGCRHHRHSRLRDLFKAKALGTGFWSSYNSIIAFIPTFACQNVSAINIFINSIACRGDL